MSSSSCRWVSKPTMPPGGHGITSVQDQIQDELLRLGHAEADSRRASSQVHRDRDVFSGQVPQQRNDLLQGVVETHPSRSVFLIATDGHKLADKPRALLGGIADFFDF